MYVSAEKHHPQLHARCFFVFQDTSLQRVCKRPTGFVPCVGLGQGVVECPTPLPLRDKSQSVRAPCNKAPHSLPYDTGTFSGGIKISRLELGSTRQGSASINGLFNVFLHKLFFREMRMHAIFLCCRSSLCSNRKAPCAKGVHRDHVCLCLGWLLSE